MSILNLTQIVSGGITNIDSAQLVMISSDTPYKMPLSDISYYGLDNVGAAWACNTPINRTTFSTITLNVCCRSLLFDFDNFTDAASPGCFWIKNDKWRYVEVGLHFLGKFGPAASQGATLRVGASQYQLAWQDQYRQLYPNSIGHFVKSGIVKVTSGDRIDGSVNAGSSLTAVDTSTSNWWIRGWSA